MAAAMKEMTKLTRNAASVRGAVMISQKPLAPSDAALIASAASGMRTIRLKYVKVKPSANPKPGMALGRFNARPRAPAIYVFPSLVGRFRLIDLVKNTPVIEVLRLRLGPSAKEGIVDRHERHIGEAGEIFRIGRARVRGTIVALGDQLLRFRRIKKLQIRLGHFARPLGVDDLVDNGDRRLRLDRKRRDHDLELVGAELVDGEEGLILPGEQDIADAALGKGRGRAARAGVEHGHVGVELLDEVLVLGLVVAVFAVGEGPGGEVVPAGAPRGLRVRRDDFDAFLSQV